MTTLKDLLNRQRAAASARQEELIKATQDSIPQIPVNQPVGAGTSFAARMDAAREEAENRRKEEERIKEEAWKQHEREKRYFDSQADDMIAEGGPSPYVPGTDIAVLNPQTGLVEYEDNLVEGDDGEYLHYDRQDYGVDDSDYFFDDIMAGVHVKPDPSQEQAVRELSQVQYGCLIGAAGTGKTTTTRLLLNTLINGDPNYDIPPLRLSRVNLRAYTSSANEQGEEGEAAGEIIPSIAFCAYTGQATQVIKKNMPGNWQKNVFTIHALLGFFPETYHDEVEDKDKMRFVPFYTKQNRMPWDVIFIDEASMVALDLWHMLLDACKPGCRIYMIGDLNQLPPPIGLGVLGFALVRWKVCELTHVHRQSNDSENWIIDTAHRVLRGEELVFQDPMTNPNWRVIGMKLEHDTKTAYRQIVNICAQLAQRSTPGGERIYDPWRDRVMTCMNGDNEDTTASLVGQVPLNDALSQIFADPSQPRYVIDHVTGQKKFAVGYRVMATKNESPAELNRVTNGLTGRIEEITENPKWLGDRRIVGDENRVRENRKLMIADALAGKSALGNSGLDDDSAKAFHEFTSADWNQVAAKETKERNGGPASHIVTVRFDNGAVRKYSMNSQIEQLMIAYASTTHKAQGAEMPTAIIVVHHAQRAMLCRENLYTAVTRASRRVIVLYSEFGLRIALGKQKITGKTLKEKIRQYQHMLGETGSGNGLDGFKLVNVRLGEGDR